MKMSKAIPVLMYHSVGIPNPNWIWKFLTIPYEIFEDHLGILKKKSFNTIDLMQLYNYVAEGKPIPPNSIVLTFDDGYLDNWVYAYPLLKKYGFKGTIFVNPEFVDPTEEYRPNLEDVWVGKVKEENLTPHGFLSWRELREMEKDGVMDVQSHGMTHTWYFAGPEIVDFRYPCDPYVWVSWNKDISRKHKYLTENQEDLIEFGVPVYQHEKSLVARRYYPDNPLDESLVQYVKSNGGKNYFQNKLWREKLFRIVEDYKSTNILRDGYESEGDKFKRFEWELKESKSILEKELKKEIQFFCWPGGGYNDLSLYLSKKYYIATTLSYKDSSIKKNIYGEDPSRIRRIGFPPIFLYKKELNKYLNGFYLYLHLKDYLGSYPHRILRKAIKFYYMIFRSYRPTL